MIENENSAENQRIKGAFVDREVISCASRIVGAACDVAGDNEDVIDAYVPVPDYESALSDAEIEPFTDEYGASCWRDKDGTTCAGDASEACEFFSIESYEREIFEHWIVTDFLGRRLSERGEKVLRDFFGMGCVWCRTTTGQAILLDSVISDICADLGLLVGEAR